MAIISAATEKALIIPEAEKNRTRCIRHDSISYIERMENTGTAADGPGKFTLSQFPGKGSSRPDMDGYEIALEIRKLKAALKNAGKKFRKG